MTGPSHVNRYRIEGTLKTESPMHIGCGRKSRYRDPGARANDPGFLVAAAERDAGDRPCIPGSALKGVVSEWARSLSQVSAACDSVFGRSATTRPGDMGTGGKVEFHYAVATDFPTAVDMPHWDPGLGTYVEAHGVTDRRTGAAAEHLLHHREVVPPATVFEVVITGENLSPDELDCILAGLAGFNHRHTAVRAKLGSGTADGRGKMLWTPTAIRRLDSSNFTAWLGGNAHGYDGFEEIPKAEFDDATGRAHATAAARSALDWLTIEIDLAFDRAFLVSTAGTGASGSPDRVPMLSPDGRVLLAASAFRGPLRSQAERIVRTRGTRACRPQDSCKPVRSLSDTKSRCLVCRTFGTTGWGTPIQLDDFRAAECDTPTQVFNPHDRIVGGSAWASSEHGMLHSVRHADRPSFRLSVSLDASRIDPDGFGLLAHVLADLCDGDISFGFGFGKGYGACTASPTRWEIGGAAGSWDDTTARGQVGSAVVAFRTATAGGANGQVP